MKTGHGPAKPSCALSRIQVEQMNTEEVKRDGFNQHGILVVHVDDPRLGWIERKILSDVGQKLYGRSARRA